MLYDVHRRCLLSDNCRNTKWAMIYIHSKLLSYTYWNKHLYSPLYLNEKSILQLVNKAISVIY